MHRRPNATVSMRVSTQCEKFEPHMTLSAGDRTGTCGASGRSSGRWSFNMRSARTTADNCACRPVHLQHRKKSPVLYNLSNRSLLPDVY